MKFFFVTVFVGGRVSFFFCCVFLLGAPHMHMKRVCIVVLSSETYFHRISFVFGVKLISKYFFNVYLFLL